MTNKNTKVVKIHDIHIDAEYASWLSEIKTRYRQAQVKAAVKVNSEQLNFNWLLGRDIVQRKAEEKWGTGIVEQLSLDLQASFPEAKGFGTSNLWYMKKWYLFYTQEGSAEKLHQLGGELGLEAKLHQLGGEFPLALAFVPWRHHVEIITQCKTIDEALFYVSRTISGNWSRSTLMNCLKADLYNSQGKAITNFADRLPAPQSELAQAITKDTYDFGFISVPEGYDENDMETELERHLTRFLLELGTGFAFLGRQKEIIVAGKTRRIDMLFYHIHLRCYIVIELKSKPFEPEFAGKLNFYVNAVDDLIKTATDNPTIGLLICSDKNQTEVQYAFRGIQTPMGVATYDNIQIKAIQEQLPSVEELKTRIRLLEEELEKAKSEK